MEMYAVHNVFNLTLPILTMKFKNSFRFGSSNDLVVFFLSCASIFPVTVSIVSCCFAAKDAILVYLGYHVTQPLDGRSESLCTLPLGLGLQKNSVPPSISNEPVTQY